MIYFLDTDICIFYLKGERKVVDAIVKLSPEKVRIPAIVEAELIDGALASNRPKENSKIIEAFCSPFMIVPFCHECASSYGRLRHELRQKGTLIGPNDLIIAATALAHHAVLITHNVKEFSRVPHLKIIDPLQ